MERIGNKKEKRKEELTTMKCEYKKRKKEGKKKIVKWNANARNE